MTKTAAQSFGDAARSRHSTSQQKAHQHWRTLAPLLTPEEFRDVRTAWSHHVDVDEGPDELDALVRKLVERGL